MIKVRDKKVEFNKAVKYLWVYVLAGALPIHLLVEERNVTAEVAL